MSKANRQIIVLASPQPLSKGEGLSIIKFTRLQLVITCFRQITNILIL